MYKIVNFRLSVYKRLKTHLKETPKIMCNGSVVNIIDENFPDNNYPILCDNGERYSFGGKNYKKGPNLTICYKENEPIIDGRLVSDITFAFRFKHLLEGLRATDPSEEEELDYFLRIADKLLRYQISTATEQNEIDYLKRLGQI